jgi:hypothetical protein
MPAKTALDAGGRSVPGAAPAEIADSATSLQWTIALSPGADDAAGPRASAAAAPSVAHAARMEILLENMRYPPLFECHRG